MRLYRFDVGVGRKIDKLGSVNFVLSGIARLDSDAQVSCIHLGPDGKVGYHQAITPQLLLVVQGEGWVRGDVGDRVPITAGHAVFWEKDEWHESSTQAGMMAIVIESKALNPAEFMPAK